MAFNRCGNMVFVEAASTAPATTAVSITDATLVVGIIVHCTHGSTSAVVTLADNNSGTSYPTLFDIEVPAANDHIFLDFSSCPLRFPNGVNFKALTNASLTLILSNARN